MKITLVTVAYNCEKIIRETIISIIEQDYSDIEYIVIDGASTDKTLKIINEYSRFIDTIVSERDKGIFDAMNKAVNLATGDYILFMNAGDRFVNNHIISDIFNNNNYDADLIYGDVYVQTELGYKLRKAKALYTTSPSSKDLVFKSQGFCHQSLFTKTTALKTVRFDTDYPLGADYDTTAKIFFTGNQQIVYVGFPISVFDDREGGASHYREIEIYKERFKMFKYTPTVIDWLRVYKEFFLSLLKRKIEDVFPAMVKKHRSKKYAKEI